MTVLVLGLVLFAVPHLFSILFRAQRDSLNASLGAMRWKLAYSAVSLVGLVLIITGFIMSRHGEAAADWMYLPAEWARHVTMLLVLFAFICIGASHGKGRIKLWLKNPMSIGIALWAAGHLLANGRRVDVYIFGTFLAVALLDIIASTLRGKAPDYVPSARSDVIAVVVGLVLYAVFLFGFHPYVLGLRIVG
jgi:uncharacterized membrane protein